MLLLLLARCCNDVKCQLMTFVVAESTSSRASDTDTAVHRPQHQQQRTRVFLLSGLQQQVTVGYTVLMRIF